MFVLSAWLGLPFILEGNASETKDALILSPTLRESLHCHILLCHHLRLWCQLQSSLAIPHPGRNAILCSHPRLVFYRSAAWNHKPDPSWLGPHPVRLHGSWKKTEISSCFYFILKKVKGTREHLETARGKKNPKNELLKRDWKVGYQIAQTLLTYCSLQRCCYQNFSLYSESKDLSCRAQKLLSETAGWITTPLLHTYATKQDVRTLQNSKIFSGNIPD